ncbi:Hsp70 family protein [Aestuariibacter salexigens]|uniref:Hsp70 family protein n=1 Tax=Aestuariibacter salexigens TaxID=226010 RepID=UPI000404B1BB|nr:Hsp70 family protein [Aestuariibacter salexigens]
MTAIGIDYGTSNSEVVYFDGQGSTRIKLDPLDPDNDKIRSSVFIYFENDLPAPPKDAIEAKVSLLKSAIMTKLEKAKGDYYGAVDPKEQEIFSRRIDALRAEYHNKPGLQRQAIGLLAREMTIDELPLNRLVETGKFAFGEEGFRRFLATPDKGRFIYSPKNFLGANLDSEQINAFTGIIARQLGYFKYCAEQQLNCPVSKAVIGRPVKFHGTRGAAGNQQAVSIMQNAAAQAGFESVSFLEEPIAAAYHIERTLEQDTTALIVDIGGGTTDICCIQLGPSKVSSTERQADVLSVVGKRLGGMECDKSLVLKAVAPAMGLGLKTQQGLPVPPSYFSDMCAVDNLPVLTRFFSEDYGLEIAQTMSITPNSEELERLMTVHEKKLSARVVNSARMAKELLSSRESITLPLHYIEADFSVTISKSTLANSMQRWLDQVTRLTQECLKNTSTAPEVAMITGGMSLSPIVVESLTTTLLENLPLLPNDAFNSISEGLAIQAYLEYSSNK